MQVPLIAQIPLPLHVIAGSQNTMNSRNVSYYQSHFISITQSHCALSSNLFHGQIAQIYINQLSDPENIKGSP